MTSYSTLVDIMNMLQAEGELVRLLPATFNEQDAASCALPIAGATCTSRDVSENQLFICKGAGFKPAYLEQALAAGAVAYLCDTSLSDELAAAFPEVPQLCVHDIRHSMALVSAEAWGHPENKLELVGVTGSKGKTTSTYMLRSIIDASVTRKAALLGSVEFYDGVESGMSANTTPEAPELFHRLANAAASGLTMVMEVSSQGLKYERTAGIDFDVVAVTNIGRDHISPVEHPSLEDYVSSKLKIFDGAKHAVIGLDTEHLERIWESAQVCEDVRTFSGSYRGEATQDVEAAAGPADKAQLATTHNTGVPTVPDYWADNIHIEPTGARFCAHTPEWTDEVTLSIPGLFNIDNALCAIALAQVLGVNREAIQTGLAQVSVPGRMEIVASADKQVLGIVDFAHNGQSFEKFFETIDAAYPQHYVISVFGCTGVKGLERREQMPPVAAAHSDLCIYTEDDPGVEPLAQIFEGMVAATPQGTNYELVDDRTEAIFKAVSVADEKAAQSQPALVCVLGKGEEARMLRAQGAEACEMDLSIVSRAIAERDARRGSATAQNETLPGAISSSPERV